MCGTVVCVYSVMVCHCDVGGTLATAGRVCDVDGVDVRVGARCLTRIHHLLMASIGYVSGVAGRPACAPSWMAQDRQNTHRVMVCVCDVWGMVACVGAVLVRVWEYLQWWQRQWQAGRRSSGV